MKIKTLFSLALAFTSLALLSRTASFAAASTNRAETKATAAADAGKLVAVTDKEAVWVAQARKTYPLDVCIASGEKLGGMGKPPEYVYKVNGKPDRLVLFCCSGCEEDFLKDPAKHLAKLDAAAAAKTKK